EFWTYNIVTCCGYPLNVVDSMQTESSETEGRSALNIILEGSNSEHLDMLKGGVIQKLLEEKWKTFGHVRIAAEIISINSSLPQIIFLSSNILIVFCIFCRLFESSYLEEVLLILALPSAWFILMFFAAY
ncbi:unnamed protein product, partial [Oppiella nova]